YFSVVAAVSLRVFRPLPTRRSSDLIAFSAEEKGLLGSDYYVQNPIYPLEQTMVNINIDMIGRIDDIHLEGNHDYIHAIGASRNRDRKSTRLNSSHVSISYAVFCLKK